MSPQGVQWKHVPVIVFLCAILTAPVTLLFYRVLPETAAKWVIWFAFGGILILLITCVPKFWK